MKFYTLSNRVEIDLEEIWRLSYEMWSVKQANRYHELLMNEIEYLSLNQDTVKKYDFGRKGYFISKVKSHMIFYKKKKEKGIDVIRILHQRMDLLARVL